MYSNVIVKMSFSSNIRLNGLKTFRVLSAKELRNIYSKYGADSIVIIENIYSDEYNEMSVFLRELTDEARHNFIVYSENDDENTTGLGDEFALDIVYSSEELYSLCDNKFNVNIRADVSADKSKQKNDYESNESELDEFVESLDATIEDIDIIEELPDIRHKTDFSDFDLGIDNIEKAKVEAPEKETIDTGEKISNAGATESESTSGGSTEASDGVEGIVEAKADTGEKISNAGATQVVNSKRTDELVKVISSLRDELNTYKELMRTSAETDIIVNPHTMQEFKSIEAELTELKGNAATISNEEIETLKNENKTLGIKLNELNKSLENVEKEKYNLDIEVMQLRSRVAELSDSTELNSKIEELSSKIAELDGIISDKTTQIEKLETDIVDRDAKIDKLIKANKSEILYRRQLTEIISDSSVKIAEAAELEETVNWFRSNEVELQNRIRTLTSRVGDLGAQLKEAREQANEKVATATNLANGQIANARRENMALKRQLDAAVAQLHSKEEQYNSIVSATGFDETGMSVFLDNTNMLKSQVENYSRQLDTTNAELKTANNRRIEAERAVNELRGQNERLNAQIRAISSGYYGYDASQMIPTINYNGKAVVLLVCGSGSFGTTTTVVSMADFLSRQNARVCVVDFDTVSPKVDELLKVSPMLSSAELPSLNNGDITNTGLGLLIEKGARYFVSNAKNIIKSSNTISPKYNIDYIGGLYYTPQSNKLVSADYSTFFRYLGGSYNYIIVDLGRLGSGSLGNQFLTAFSRFATRVVVVTRKSNIDVRNTRKQLLDAKISIDKIAWLINLANDTRITDNMNRTLMNINFDILNFSPDFYGSGEVFFEAGGLSKKFQQFIVKTVLQRLR